MINCLAYITPLNVTDRANALNGDYKMSAMALATILMDNLPDCVQHFRTHSLKIVEHLLANTWDKTHFESLFGIRINFIAANHAINHQMFSDSLVYIQVSLPDRHISTNASHTFSFPNFRINSVPNRTFSSIFSQQSHIVWWNYCTH